MNKVIMIFIDAFSSEYLNQYYSPFLHDLQEDGYVKHIEPLPAFAGIGTTLFSGTWPITNGAWTNFVKNDKKPDFPSYIINLFAIFDLIPNDRLRWDLKYVVYRALKKPVPIPNQMPSHLINFFKSKVEKSMFQDDFIDGIPTLFSIVRGCGKSYTAINKFMASDEKIAKMTIDYLKREDCSDLTYLKFSSLDLFGHIFGPSSSSNCNRVKMIDNLIREIKIEADKSSEDFTFIIFSDHGMSPVSKYLDIQECLEKTSLNIIEDYFIFIDSTMARFWFNTQEAREKITTVLNEIEDGYIVSDSDLQENNLPINKKEYGELIFALNEGIVMQPDFFHINTIMKGMHGHIKSIYDKPIILIHPPIINNGYVRFIDVMPTTLALLGIPIPDTCEGKSLV